MGRNDTILRSKWTKNRVIPPQTCNDLVPCNHEHPPFNRIWQPLTQYPAAPLKTPRFWHCFFSQFTTKSAHCGSCFFCNLAAQKSGVSPVRSCIFDRQEAILERWPSGLRRTPGKRVGGRLPRGFESLSLRWKSATREWAHAPPLKNNSKARNLSLR